MISHEAPPATVTSLASSPRISFSADFLDDDDADFICINPHDREREAEKTKNGEFEFLSSDVATPTTMLTADELFFDGKFLPFRLKQCSETLAKININAEKPNEVITKEVRIEESNRMSWFIDEDPSPRPPKCTVLWKELLRLKKQRSSSLSPSSSTSSSSSGSSGSSGSSLDEKSRKKEKPMMKSKRGLERTRSAGLKIRPMVNVPVYTQSVRTNSLPPLFSIRKPSLDRGKL